MNTAIIHKWKDEIPLKSTTVRKLSLYCINVKIRKNKYLRKANFLEKLITKLEMLNKKCSIIIKYLHLK